MAQQHNYWHDCDDCQFMGTYQRGEALPIDVYWCVNPRNPALDSIIGQDGNAAPSYAVLPPPFALASGADFLRIADGWYLFALCEAARRGL